MVSFPIARDSAPVLIEVPFSSISICILVEKDCSSLHGAVENISDVPMPLEMGFDGYVPTE